MNVPNNRKHIQYIISHKVEGVKKGQIYKVTSGAVYTDFHLRFYDIELAAFPSFMKTQLVNIWAHFKRILLSRVKRKRLRILFMITQKGSLRKHVTMYR